MPKHIYDLGHDIFAIILDYLSRESSKPLYNLSLASVPFSNLARKYLYRKLRFTFARCWEARNALLLRRLERDRNAAASVHEIYINWAPGVVPRKETSTNTALIHQLTYLVPNLTSLKRLVWDAQCAILPTFYDKLARYAPSCELYTRCPSRNDTARALQLLHDSTQLVALEITLEKTQHYALLELRKVLAICTNLKKLQVSWKSFPNAPAAGFGGMATLCTPENRLPSLKVLKLQGLAIVDCSQDGWEGCADWEALESLHCMDVQIFPMISALLKNLRSLGVYVSKQTLWLSEQENAVLELIDASPNLEELSLTGMTFSLKGRDFLSRRNSSLKYIKIHENQVYGDVGEFVRQTLDIEDIKKLGISYPQLERCSIDLHIDLDWPLDTLSRIAESLSFITELELNLDLHIPQSGSSRVVATLPSVLHIWHFLWRTIENFRQSQNHITSRPRLRTLRIQEGSFRQVWDIPRQAMNRECSEQATFEARLSEREDLAEWGYADVVCLELEALRNKYGFGEQEEQAKADLMRAVVERAERGPRQWSVQFTLGHLDDFLRPLRTPLLTMADMD